MWHSIWHSTWRLRSSSAHCDQELGGEEEKKKKRKEEEARRVILKSNNPHLAGGEKIEPCSQKHAKAIQRYSNNFLKADLRQKGYEKPWDIQRNLMFCHRTKKNLQSFDVQSLGVVDSKAQVESIWIKVGPHRWPKPKLAWIVCMYLFVIPSGGGDGCVLPPFWKFRG